MENLTDLGNHTRIQQINCTTGLYGTQQKIVLSVINSLLSITAFLGNVLIIAALQKVQSLHPPSRLLLSCLAITDLCVGLIAQPLYASFLLSQKHSKHCYYVAVLSNTIAAISCGVSLLTLTVISVDRLLVLLLNLRYRQVVTLRRVKLLVVSFWLSSFAFAIILYLYHDIAIRIMYINMLLCIVTFTFCYIKIHLTLKHHQAQVQEEAHQQPNGGGPSINIVLYRKTVSSTLWLQMTLLACYIPYGIISIFALTGLRSPTFDLAWDSTLTLLFLNSTLNPFLYQWKIRHLRQAVTGMVKRSSCSLTVACVQHV
ncbi:melanocyte-stimulating hormone receptor-like [Orbicella faveolata]|uniref:melanocyte-stimulating hormone receptor-like n=1 Tax=Orbicella faveolata TaxID=48498 RepID=UPI0009E42EA4|nr:melanocyte-stimulating hormone receptor-like [Orbicella faveolata]